MSDDKKHIILFEDEPPTRALVEEILTSAGYSVTSCARGMEVLGAVRRQPPDLIVSDLNVPGLSGQQVIVMLRRSGNYEGPILVLSGRTREDDIRTALDAGAQAFLKKPVKRGELLEAVSGLLNPGTGDSAGTGA